MNKIISLLSLVLVAAFASSAIAADKNATKSDKAAPVAEAQAAPAAEAEEAAAPAADAHKAPK